MKKLQREISTSTYAIPPSSMVDDAIRKSLIYGDVFDFALTIDEIYRYLIGHKASMHEIHQSLHERMLPARQVIQAGNYFMLLGRGNLGAQRQKRERIARQALNRALRFGRWISHLPFIRMVALTGALAAQNHRSDEDFDYFVITKQGYLWMARGLILLLNRIVSNERFSLCPNYIISENNLALAERDLYTAQELVRMIPISGLDIYFRLRQQNRWTDELLPNAGGPPPAQKRSKFRLNPLQFLLEPLLDSPIGRRIESWEMKRKIAQLNQLHQFGDEVRLSAEQCKGHFDGHRISTMTRYLQKIDTIQGETSL